MEQYNLLVADLTISLIVALLAVAVIVVKTIVYCRRKRRGYHTMELNYGLEAGGVKRKRIDHNVRGEKTIYDDANHRNEIDRFMNIFARLSNCRNICGLSSTEESAMIIPGIEVSLVRTWCFKISAELQQRVCERLPRLLGDNDINIGMSLVSCLAAARSSGGDSESLSKIHEDVLLNLDFGTCAIDRCWERFFLLMDSTELKPQTQEQPRGRLETTIIDEIIDLDDSSDDDDGTALSIQEYTPEQVTDIARRAMASIKKMKKAGEQIVQIEEQIEHSKLKKRKKKVAVARVREEFAKRLENVPRVGKAHYPVQREIPQRAYFDAILAGKVAVTFLVDSGAPRSIIPIDILNRMRTAILPQQLQVLKYMGQKKKRMRCAGSKFNTYGETTLPVFAGEGIPPLNIHLLIVNRNKGNVVLLGMDFLVANRCRMDFGKNASIYLKDLDLYLPLYDATGKGVWLVD